MKCTRTVTLTKPVTCGASIADACAAVDSLSRPERLELVALLQDKYPKRFGS